MKLVLDTSIIIDYLRGGSLWEIVLTKIDKSAIFYIPTVVIYELFSGKSTRNIKVIEKINIFLKYFERIELTEKIAKHAGQLYRDDKPKIGAADYIIAAAALSIGASVLTLNQKHFQEIPGLEIYEF